MVAKIQLAAGRCLFLLTRFKAQVVACGEKSLYFAYAPWFSGPGRVAWCCSELLVLSGFVSSEGSYGVAGCMISTPQKKDLVT